MRALSTASVIDTHTHQRGGEIDIGLKNRMNQKGEKKSRLECNLKSLNFSWKKYSRKPQEERESITRMTSAGANS